MKTSTATEMATYYYRLYLSALNRGDREAALGWERMEAKMLEKVEANKARAARKAA